MRILVNLSLSSDEDNPSEAVSSDHEYDLEDISNVLSCSRCAHV